jgi:aminoglycoside phosphotransferase (APT) family kinase protein
LTADEPAGVDPAAVAAFLAANVPELDGPFTVARLGEGQSCLTYLLSGAGWEVVLRRPPRGELPRGAYDVVREHRVLSALTDAGTGVPVPRPLALCEDTDVLGAPFYLMERVHGQTVRTTLPPALAGRPDRRRMGEALVDVLVALRAIDVGAVGLEGHGRPDGYLARQLRRMGEQREAVRGRALPELDALGAWLADHVPDSPAPALLHGDLKLDNVILAPASPARVAAVIDWELSTLGDPLADLGWLLYFWREEGEEPFAIPVANVTHMPGFPRRAELRRRYEELTGAPVPDARWYAALGGWKIAVIMETSYLRFRAGVADHPTFAALEEGVGHLARRALAFAEGALTT